MAHDAHQIQHADGRVELDDAARQQIKDSPLYNPDLAPVPVSRRNWSTYNFAALWISMAHCIPTYMLASGLIKSGMSWRQALFTIFLGNTIVLVPILLNSHPGTRYGIPFPVLARASYGVYGANLPALMRALVACGWFGINAWIGGAVLHTFFTSVYPGWPHLFGAHPLRATLFGHDLLGAGLPAQWVAFLLFWLLNIWVIYRGMDLVRRLENFAAPFVLAMGLVLLVWAVNRAHGLGPIFHQSHPLSTGDFLKIFPISLTGMIGFWATLSLNMPDFTRYGRSQRAQMIGQAVALPTTMLGFSAMAVVITSATAILFGKVIWRPELLIGELGSPLIVGLAALTLVVATLAVNIAANVVSPANDFSNLAPRHISFRTGALLTGVMGILFMPWKLTEDAHAYIQNWLVAYSGGLAPIAAVMIVDYFVVRRRHLALLDLYLPDGSYRYQGGWNRRAVAATLLGCLCAWIGLVIPALRPLFNYAWFVGFGVAGIAYYGLMAAVQKTDPRRSSPA